MSKIIDVRTAVINFLKDNIHPHEITVIKLDKVGDMWESISEVYEDDSFLKAMYLPPKHARVYYSVKIDDQLEVVAFERMTEYSQ
jgi:hypothetical protein